MADRQREQPLAEGDNGRERYLNGLRRRLPWLLFPGLLLLFFHRMAFSNLILARGDTFLYFYPYWTAAAGALQAGRFPLWNPNLFMGAPLLANSQVGFFYPLNWPVWLWLPTPYAVSASILVHLLLAGVGAYLAAAKLLHVGRWAAFVTAICFALGGYLTAQVEHINQLQGMAWLPWYLALIGWCSRRSDRRRWPSVGWATVGFALLFTLQFLAGHTQTVFISGIVILVWSGAEFASILLSRQTEFALQFSFRARRLRRLVLPALLLGGLIAALLTAVQLLPTLELSQYSSRQGGLTFNEVLSFSLNPLLLAQSLLPTVGQSLFTEYVAFLPMTAMVLAVIGAWQWRRWPGVLAAMVLVVLGLLLAVGIFNPLNWLLAPLPGFNLFRVPARWLLVYALGMSMLAGVGFQVAYDRWLQRVRPWAELPETVQTDLAHIERPLRAALLLVVGLMAWNALAGILAIVIPTGPEAPFTRVNPSSLLLWLVELILIYVILVGERPVYRAQSRFRVGLKRMRPMSPLWLLPLMIGVLFAASRSQPYNNLTTPEAYFDLRPPITRLQAATEGIVAPGRLLSLSDIFFDVGDQPEIDAIYGDQLPLAAQYDYTIAVKHKEVLGPNLPLTYGLASVDGFDGGILPLRRYSDLMRLILPEGQTTVDGRLRENLEIVPEAKWLDMFSARYLITDKTGDLWYDGVFFDRQHPVTLLAGEEIAIGHVVPFSATTVLLLADGPPAQVTLTTEDGARLDIVPTAVAEGIFEAKLPETAFITALSLKGCVQGCRLDGVTLVNETDETHVALVPGAYRLMHSGDVKIYENLDALPRAYLVSSWTWQSEETAMWAALAADRFEPRATAVLLGEGERVEAGDVGYGEVEIVAYEPGRILLRAESETPRLLILSEAAYPGWQATVDNEAVPIWLANGYFQGIQLPPGKHEVTFSFAPQSFAVGAYLSLAGLLLWLLLAAILILHLRSREHSNFT